MKRAVMAMTSLSLLAQIIGFGKSVLMGHLFGVSIELDGYYLAQIVPALISAVLLGAIQSGFVPVYMRIKHDGEEALNLRSIILRRLVFFAVTISLLSLPMASLVVALVAPNADASVISAGIKCYKVISTALAINLLADYLGLVLNAEMRFASVAIASSINALVALLLLIIWPEWGLDNLIWGLVAGALFQLLINFMQLKKLGKHFIASPAKPDSLREAEAIGVKILPGIIFSNISMSIPQIAVASLGIGAISTFGYANRFHGVFVQTIAMGISTVLLSHFAIHAAQKRYRELAHILKRAFLPLISLSLIAVLWVFLAGEPALRLLFSSGKMTAKDIGSIHEVWLILTIGLPAILWGIFSAKALQALGRTGSLSILSFIGLIVTTIAAWMGTRWGVSGVAGAVGVSYTVVTVLTYREVRRELSEPILVARDWLQVSLMLVCVIGLSIIGYMEPEVKQMDDVPRIIVISFVSLALVWLAYKFSSFRVAHENR